MARHSFRLNGSVIHMPEIRMHRRAAMNASKNNNIRK